MPVTQRTRSLTAVLLLLTATEAHTSESHENLSLESVVRQSSAILLVEKADPPTKKTQVPVAKGAPPYERTQHRFVVKEVLHLRGVGPRVAPGATLEVDAADYGTRLTVHRKYYVENVRKIPIYSFYRPQPSDAGESTQEIVFLTHGGSGWEFTASGAREHPSRRAAIEAAIAAKPQ